MCLYTSCKGDVYLGLQFELMVGHGRGVMATGIWNIWIHDMQSRKRENENMCLESFQLLMQSRTQAQGMAPHSAMVFLRLLTQPRKFLTDITRDLPNLNDHSQMCLEVCLLDDSRSCQLDNTKCHSQWASFFSPQSWRGRKSMEDSKRMKYTRH